MNQPIRILIAVIALVMLNAAGVNGFPLLNYLNIQYAVKPTPHPSGNEFAYITNITGVPQVWRISAGSGYQNQVSFDTNGVEAAWWSPVYADLLIVAAAVGGNERSQLYQVNPYGGEWVRLTDDDNAIYRFGCWAADGARFAYASNTRNRVDFDIYEYDVTAMRPTLLYQGSGTNSAVSYSPDNRYLLIERMYSASNGDILLFDRESGATRPLTEHTGNVIFTSPLWDAEGEGFYLLTDRDREFSGLAYWPLDSADFRWVATPDWDVEQLALSRDGAYLAWTVNENGSSVMHIRNLRRGTDSPPSRFPRGVMKDLRFTNDGSKLFYTYGSGDRQFDVWVYETYADKLHQATFSATGGIPRTSFISPALIEYPTFDGRKIPAFWYKPLGVKGKMPVVVAIHGGPEAQARPDMSGLFQYFLSRGFAILEPNIRGSSGYGKSYMDLDNVEKRPDAIKDIEAAADWLTTQPDIDAKKLAIFGGSYGGYAVFAALANYPKTWAAGVSIVGIANFVTFLENTGGYRRALREAEYGRLATDRELLESISPLNSADKIRAPLFIIQGANDPRVPKSEAEQMVEAIHANGGIVEYLLFEDEGHGLTKTKNRIAAYSAVAEFLSKYVSKK